MSLAGVLSLTVTSARAAAPVSPAELAEVRTFLDEYTALSRSQSPDFYDLYTDRATVHVRVQGQANEFVLLGRSYKDWSRQLLLAHRSAIDDSEFHEAVVEQHGNRVIIRAKRYSASRCFWDADYTVALERSAVSLRIVDERLTTAPSGVCQMRQETSLPELKSDIGNHSLTGTSTAWRPMTPEEIARSALKLAREVADARNSEKPAPSALPSILNSGSPQVTRIADTDPLLVTPAEN